MKKVILTIYLCILFLLPKESFAGGELVTSFDAIVSKFALDPNRNIIYASTTNNNSIAIIDMNLLSIVDSIFVGSSPAGLTVSPDSHTLYVALGGASRIAIVNLDIREVVDYIELPSPAFDVKLGNGRLYATPMNQITSGIMQIDLSSKNVTAIFSEGVSIYTRGMLEISPDRNYLYFANVGLSPGTLAKYDVSTDTPSLLIRNPHGALGSNGQDLAISQDGNQIYYAVGGGNGAIGYDIFQLSTTTFSPLGAFATGAYPREITVSPDGKTAYAVHTSGHIDVWNAQAYLQIKQYSTTGEADELITDHSGNYLLAAFSNQLRVYAAEGSEPRIDSDADGIDDAIDNCVNDFNPNQEDADNDWIGDICDPFPSEANHPFAQCSAELNKVLELRDTDNDGEIDRNDKCPNTQLGLEVDDSGCSLNEFCNNYSRESKNLCEGADWKNDEPLLKKPKNCVFYKNPIDNSTTCTAAY